jgi:hypothetical protein
MIRSILINTARWGPQRYWVLDKTPEFTYLDGNISIEIYRRCPPDYLFKVTVGAQIFVAVHEDVMGAARLMVDDASNLRGEDVTQYTSIMNRLKAGLQAYLDTNPGRIE